MLNSKHYSRGMARVAQIFLAIDHNPRGCKAKGDCLATSLDTVTSLKTLGRLYWKENFIGNCPFIVNNQTAIIISSLQQCHHTMTIFRIYLLGVMIETTPSVTV